MSIFKLPYLVTCLIALILFSCQNEQSNKTNVKNDENTTLPNIIELNIEDDQEKTLVPVFKDIERLGFYQNDQSKIVYWGDFTFILPFEDFGIEEVESGDHIDTKISKIHNGVIYSIRLSDYGIDMIGDKDFDPGFLYYRHQGQTEGSKILSEVKFLHFSKGSYAIYTCSTYALNEKEYFEDLLTVKHGQYIFEMSVTGSPKHESFELVKTFFDGFIIL